MVDVGRWHSVISAIFGPNQNETILDNILVIPLHCLFILSSSQITNNDIISIVFIRDDRNNYHQLSIHPFKEKVFPSHTA